MRRWPKSLVGQLLLAVALTLFVAQSANLWLLDRAQRQQFVVQVGGVAAARIYDVIERERRDGVTLAAGEYVRGRVVISLTPPAPPPGARSMPKLAEHVREVLSAHGSLGCAARVGARRGQRHAPNGACRRAHW
jgi:hypothetical protein